MFDIDITRRRVLVALVAVSIAAAGAGAGTMAMFSDTEQSTGNTVQAGTLDLKIDSGDSGVTLLSVDSAAPGDSGSNSTALKNTGSIDGSLDVNVSVSLNENGVNEPEDDSSESSGTVELGSEMTVTIGIDDDGDGLNSSETIYSGDVASAEQDFDVDEELTAGETDDLIIKYDVPSSAGNEIQSDKAVVDATVDLEQNAD